MLDAQLLGGEIAIVTGGTAGIGKSIAQTFVNQGAKVVLFGTNPDRGQSAVDEIGEQASFLRVDVSNFEQVQAAIKQVIEDHGVPNILVNNAGITRDNLLLKMTEEDWDRVIDVNLKSCYNTCKALARPLIRSRKGKIINVTSVVGLQGNAGQMNYAASKAGLIGLTKSLARELAPRNICVNCVAPGYIQTDMTGKLNDQQKEAIQGSIPLGRMGQPEDIAQAVLFLAAASGNYITGQVIVVDGGMVM